MVPLPKWCEVRQKGKHIKEKGEQARPSHHPLTLLPFSQPTSPPLLFYSTPFSTMSQSISAHIPPSVTPTTHRKRKNGEGAGSEAKPPKAPKAPKVAKDQDVSMVVEKAKGPEVSCCAYFLFFTSCVKDGFRVIVGLGLGRRVMVIFLSPLRF